jgi:hypothetical protein
MHDEAGEDIFLLQPAVNLVTVVVPLELLATSVRKTLADVAHLLGSLSHHNSQTQLP